MWVIVEPGQLFIKPGRGWGVRKSNVKGWYCIHMSFMRYLLRAVEGHADAQSSHRLVQVAGVHRVRSVLNGSVDHHATLQILFNLRRLALFSSA